MAKVLNWLNSRKNENAPNKWEILGAMFKDVGASMAKQEATALQSLNEFYAQRQAQQSKMLEEENRQKQLDAIFGAVTGQQPNVSTQVPQGVIAPSQYQPISSQSVMPNGIQPDLYDRNLSLMSGKLTQSRQSEKMQDVQTNVLQKSLTDPMDIAKSKEEAKIQQTKEVNTEESKKLAEKYGEMARMVGAFRNLIGERKKAVNSFGNLGAKAAMTYDISQMRYTPNVLKEKARPLAAAQAQTEEVSISVLPFLSGQTRYVESLAERIKKTVPGIEVPENIGNDLIAQSVRNFMTLGYAIKKGYVTEKKLRDSGIDPNSTATSDADVQSVLGGVKLSEKEMKSIDDAISYVLQAPAAPYSEKYQNQDLQKLKNKYGLQ